LEAAERFARGEPTGKIAAELRVTDRVVRKWRHDWRAGGVEALRSKGPVSAERLSSQQWARLESELAKGPLFHGFADDQRWTLSRVKTVIGRLFHVGYTIQGVAKLLKRHGWSCQVPVRRALERDEQAIAAWKDQVWPRVKAPRRTWAPGSVSQTRQARG
jgi:putative transposase